MDSYAVFALFLSPANRHSLTPNEQRELQNRMEKKQMKEFMNVMLPR